MSDYTDEGLSRRLKAILEGRKLTVKSVAATIGVPYRALQNQLIGHNKMTASTLAKLLTFLELPLEVVTDGRLRPPPRHLAAALRRLFGDELLPGISDDMAVTPPVAGRDAGHLHRNANALAYLLCEYWEKEVLTPSDYAVIFAEERSDGVSK